MSAKLGFILIAILTIAFWRILPHPANVTPVMATALFCGAYLKDKKMAFLLPLLAMLVSDLFIGLHGSMLFVYGSIAITVGAGIVFLQQYKKPLHIFTTTVVCSLIFFFVTNFGAWLYSAALYPRSVEGLLQAYVAGIPFYRNSILGDLFFAAVLFGGYAFIETLFTSRSTDSAIK